MGRSVNSEPALIVPLYILASTTLSSQYNPQTTRRVPKMPHMAKEGDIYASIYIRTSIYLSLLLAANPSLGKEFLEFSAKLIVKRVHYTGPTYGLNEVH